MKVTKVPISSIEIPEYNPNRMNASQMEALKRSIQTYDNVQPIVWNSLTGNAVGGSHRLLALQALGHTEVEVVEVRLDLEKEKALNLALNKIHGQFDQDKLAVLISELAKIPDFDIAQTGFNLPEISEILDQATSGDAGDDFDPDAAVGAIIEPITRRGDVIKLGLNKLMCGDATSKEDLRALLCGEKVNLLAIDWPYNVNYMGGSCPRVDTHPKKLRKWEKIYSDNMPQAEYETFMRTVLLNVKEHLELGAAFYQWQAHRQLGPLYQILTELDFHLACLICWMKECAAISYADYSFQTEQAVYGWLKGASHYFAGKPGESNLWQVKRDPTSSYGHPCQKPIELATREIKNSTKRGEIVLDTFLGSGSVLIGAQKLGRRCFGMELDEKYCDVAVRRYLAVYGRDSVSPEVYERYVKEV